MARRRNSYRRSSYGGRRSSYRSRGRGGRRGGMGLKLSPAFLAGALVGFTDLDNKIPGQIVLAAAAAPVSGLGLFKAGAQGIIIGNLAQQLIANRGVSSGGFQGI